MGCCNNRVWVLRYNRYIVLRRRCLLWLMNRGGFISGGCWGLGTTTIQMACRIRVRLVISSVSVSRRVPISISQAQFNPKHLPLDLNNTRPSLWFPLTLRSNPYYVIPLKVTNKSSLVHPKSTQNTPSLTGHIWNSKHCHSSYLLLMLLFRIISCTYWRLQGQYIPKVRMRGESWAWELFLLKSSRWS